MKGRLVNRSCVDHIFTLNELVQGRIREDKQTFAFFLDVQKAYDTVCVVMVYGTSYGTWV